MKDKKENFHRFSDRVNTQVWKNVKHINYKPYHQITSDISAYIFNRIYWPIWDKFKNNI